MLKIVWVVYNVEIWAERYISQLADIMEDWVWDVSLSNIFCSILWNQWSGCPAGEPESPACISQWCVTSHIGNATLQIQPEIREFVFRLQLSLKTLIKHWLYCGAGRLHLLSLPSCWAITKQRLDWSEWAGPSTAACWLHLRGEKIWSAGWLSEWLIN